MKRRRGWGTSGLISLIALAAIAIAFAISSGPSTADRSGKAGRQNGNADDGVATTRSLAHSFLLATDKPIYPEKWRTSLDDALKGIKFDSYIPAEGSRLSVDELTDVFLFPEGSALVLAYPPITSTDAVRKNFVEVYEAPWTEPDDALTTFETELEVNPADGQALSTLADGIPALTVQPRSKTDLEHANAAYLEFNLNGTYIQISGGNSLDDLVSIANELIQSAHAA